MKKEGFDNQLYIQRQSAEIQKRIAQLGGKLYLEFGGKLFDDFHASRVLPGFAPDSKIQMLRSMADKAEIIIAINAGDIVKNKIRGDLGITYDQDVLRLIDAFRGFGLFVSSVVITRYTGQPTVEAFQQKLEKLGLRVYRHYPIEGYPYNVPVIISEAGFGKNEYVETQRPLVVVTAPGPGSGKLAVCLSQLYHENLRGVNAGYAKFETFPIWNLPLKHPVNLAYEAATADLNDVNMIDPYHLETYGVTTVNYNRDVEAFPVLNAMFERMSGSSPYHSPTDMGVNMAGNCIVNDEACRKASCEEILRRYYDATKKLAQGKPVASAVRKLELLMQKAGVKPGDRAVVAPALEREKLTGAPAVAIELNDGRIFTGRTSPLMGACANATMNALKALAGIEDERHLLSPEVIEPIQKLKVKHLGSQNPRLHTEEMLLALSVCAASDPQAQAALDQLSALRGCEMHSTVILSAADEEMFRRLGVNLTCEPKYEGAQLFHR